MSNASLMPFTKKRKRGKASESKNWILEPSRAPNLEMQKPSIHGVELRLIELEHMALSTQPRTILSLRGRKMTQICI